MIGLMRIVFISLLLLLYGCKEQHTQYSGYVEGENIFLASPYSGVLKQLLVQRGQPVKQGQPLFALDPNPQHLQLQQMQNELAQAKNILTDMMLPKRIPEIKAIQAQIEQTNAQIKLAEIRVDRFQKLYARQATDKDSLDAALANLQQQQELKAQYESNLSLAQMGSRDEQIKAQKNQWASLQAKYQQMQWQLVQKKGTAPANGVVFDTYYLPGEFVPAQQAVLSLLTPQNTRIEFFVPLAEMNHLKINQEISFTALDEQEHFRAVISYISPDAEYLPPLVYSRDNSSKLVFRVKAQIKDSGDFKPGQPVMVTL